MLISISELPFGTSRDDVLGLMAPESGKVRRIRRVDDTWYGDGGVAEAIISVSSPAEAYRVIDRLRGTTYRGHQIGVTEYSPWPSGMTMTVAVLLAALVTLLTLVGLWLFSDWGNINSVNADRPGDVTFRHEPVRAGFAMAVVLWLMLAGLIIVGITVAFQWTYRSKRITAWRRAYGSEPRNDLPVVERQALLWIAAGVVLVSLFGVGCVRTSTFQEEFRVDPEQRTLTVVERSMQGEAVTQISFDDVSRVEYRIDPEREIESFTRTVSLRMISGDTVRLASGFGRAMVPFARELGEASGRPVHCTSAGSLLDSGGAVQCPWLSDGT